MSDNQNRGVWIHYFYINKIQSHYESQHLLCSVAKASSSLLTMMVCWEGTERVLRGEGSWVWSLSMWNFRWPLRLNLKGEEVVEMLYNQ